MDYIINPWWFYLVQVCDTSKIIFCILGLAPLFFGAVFWVCEYIEMNDACDNDDCFQYHNCKADYNRSKKRLRLYKRMAIVGAIILTISILLPQKDTLIKMQITKFGTYSNAEKVLEVIDDKTDALIDAIGSNKEN